MWRGKKIVGKTHVSSCEWMILFAASEYNHFNSLLVQIEKNMNKINV